MSEHELPPAPPDLEEHVRMMVGEGLSPGEYAARWAHSIMAFSLDNYRYRDTDSHEWIQALGAILFQRPGFPTLQELRERYLTAEERATIEKHAQEDL
jgi:hypothetical protein